MLPVVGSGASMCDDTADAGINCMVTVLYEPDWYAGTRSTHRALDWVTPSAVISVTGRSSMGPASIT